MPSAWLMSVSFDLGVLGQTVEIEALAAGQDGRQHLVGLGGGQDEDDVRRWLLQRLQQGVGGLAW